MSVGSKFQIQCAKCGYKPISWTSYIKKKTVHYAKHYKMFDKSNIQWKTLIDITINKVEYKKGDIVTGEPILKKRKEYGDKYIPVI